MTTDQIVRALAELERTRKANDILSSFIARALGMKPEEIVSIGIRPFGWVKYCKAHPNFIDSYWQALRLAATMPPAKDERGFVTRSEVVKHLQRLEQLRKKQGRSHMEIVDLLPKYKFWTTVGVIQSIAINPEDHVVALTEHRTGFIDAYYKVLGFTKGIPA